MMPPITATAAHTAASTPEKLGQAAKQFEAYFLRRMLAEMRAGSRNPLFGGGIGGRMFDEMLHEALSDSMAAGGGVGLADTLAAELGGKPAKRRAALGAIGAVRRYAQQAAPDARPEKTTPSPKAEPPTVDW